MPLETGQKVVVEPPQYRLHALQASTDITEARHGTQASLATEPIDDIRGDLPPPSTAVEALQRWNSPPGNKWRLFATFFAFTVVGLNDAANGVLPTISLLLVLRR